MDNREILINVPSSTDSINITIDFKQNNETEANNKTEEVTEGTTVDDKNIINDEAESIASETEDDTVIEYKEYILCIEDAVLERKMFTEHKYTLVIYRKNHNADNTEVFKIEDDDKKYLIKVGIDIVKYLCVLLED